MCKNCNCKEYKLTENVMKSLNFIYSTNNKKISFDIHGVIDTFPEFFSHLSKVCKERNHKVYIVTGNMKTEKIIKELNSYDITYDEFFSVSDHLIYNGHEVHFKDEDHPYFDIELWNKTKGEFCKNEKIDIHFDDTEEYEKYFDKYITTFILII